MLNEGVASLVFDCGSGLFLAGFAAYDASYAEFALVVGRTGMFGILVGMDQKDRYVARCPHPVVHMPVVCNDRCRGSSGAENCGFFSSCSSSTRSSTFLSSRGGPPQLLLDKVVDVPFYAGRAGLPGLHCR